MTPHVENEPGLKRLSVGLHSICDSMLMSQGNIWFEIGGDRIVVGLGGATALMFQCSSTCVQVPGPHLQGTNFASGKSSTAGASFFLSHTPISIFLSLSNT